MTREEQSATISAAFVGLSLALTKFEETARAFNAATHAASAAWDGIIVALEAANGPLDNEGAPE